ncbi:MAG: tetratricopeptide repeat protein [Candidatus Omnitrophota bacterium]
MALFNITNIYDSFWDLLSDKEQEIYALLSIPVWFDEELAGELNDHFNPSALEIFYTVIREVNFVFMREKNNWHFGDEFREYLLIKAEGIYKDKVNDINRFLQSYFAEKGKQIASGAKKRQSDYLSIYHHLQWAPDEAARSVLKRLEKKEEKDLIPLLRSLDYVFQLPPGKFKNDSIALFLNLYMSSFENKKDKSALKKIEEGVEQIQEKLDKENDRLLLKQVYSLRIQLIEWTDPNNPKNIKKLKKLKQKLNGLSGAYSSNEEGDEAPILQNNSRKDFRKHQQIKEIIDRIVSCHKKGMHDRADEELGYLKMLHGEERDRMCKSFCNIAQKLKIAHLSIDLQDKYIGLAIRANKFDSVALNAKAELLARMGKVDDALELLDQSHRLNPNDQVSLNAKAELLGRIGKVDDALELLDQSHRINPNDEVALTAKAELLARMGKVDDALALFDQSHRLNPHNEISLTAKAELLARMGKVDDALALFDQAHQLNPHNQVPLNAKAELLGRIGKVNEALALFDQSHRLNPHDQVSLTAKAELLARIGKVEEALELFDQAYRLNPNDEVSLTAKAELLGRIERVDDALTLLDQAHQINPHNEVSLNAKAELLARIGKVDDALALFDQAHRLNPHNEVSLNAKAELLGRIGKVDEALALFDQSHQLNPYDAVALNAASNLLATYGRKEEAIEKYRITLNDQGKNDPYTMCGLGFLLLERNQNETDIIEAKNLFDRARKFPGSETIASLGLWVAHARLGNESEASQFKKLFEEKQQGEHLEISPIENENEEVEFNNIKDEITVEHMTDMMIYRNLMPVVLTYAIHIMMRKQMMYHRFSTHLTL